MEESFPFRQMQKFRSSLGEDDLLVRPAPESRDSIIARAEAALQRVAELVAQDPELRAMVEELQRQGPEGLGRGV